jgi:hypothetical protein
MVQNRTTNFRSSAEQFFLGSIALASANLASLRPGIYLASTAFARSAVEAQGGRMSAADNVRPGARFQFMLPLQQEDTL